MADQKPTVEQLQAQLVAVRERLREVEGIVFRPVNVTIVLPSGMTLREGAKTWWIGWRKRRRDAWLRRAKERARAQAWRNWNRLNRKARRNPRAVSLLDLERAFRATHLIGWRPPKPWRARLREWWSARQERREIAKLRRLMAAAKPEDVERERLKSLARQERVIATRKRDGLHAEGYVVGRAAIVKAQRTELPK